MTIVMRFIKSHSKTVAFVLVVGLFETKLASVGLTHNPPALAS